MLHIIIGHSLQNKRKTTSKNPLKDWISHMIARNINAQRNYELIRLKISQKV